MDFIKYNKSQISAIIFIIFLTISLLISGFFGLINILHSLNQNAITNIILLLLIILFCIIVYVIFKSIKTIKNSSTYEQKTINYYMLGVLLGMFIFMLSLFVYSQDNLFMFISIMGETIPYIVFLSLPYRQEYSWPAAFIFFGIVFIVLLGILLYFLIKDKEKKVNNKRKISDFLRYVSGLIYFIIAFIVVLISQLIFHVIDPKPSCGW